MASTINANNHHRASLGDEIGDERSQAIRVLLANPVLDIDNDPDSTRLVIRHAEALTEWFEDTLGFRLDVDASAGFVRLYKRAAEPDPTRALHRTRGTRSPFDRRRYQLLCLTCALLVRHSVTTIGLLADSLRGEARLDTTLRRERAALVDVLRALDDWGILRSRGGELDAYVDSAASNAILSADTHRLHRLLASATPPTRLGPATTTGEQATAALLAEPRYGDGPDAATEAQRLRWTRHTVARLVFDNPVVYFDDVHPAVADYLGTAPGRQWLRTRAEQAGFDLEERSEGIMAIDPQATATDIVFPSPLGTVGQLALLLIDELSSTVRTDADTDTNDGASDADRRLGALTRAELSRFVQRCLDEQPGWARSHREGDGPDRLVAEAAELLAKFGLVAIDDAGRVTARPALARYRVTLAEVNTGAAGVQTALL